MMEERKFLFGVDESEFSMHSLASVGEMIGQDERFRIQVFHGAPDPSPGRVLERAKTVLMEAGIPEGRISLIFRKGINPGGEMLDYAEKEGFGILSVARLGASTMGRHVIGSVSYRLASSSERIPVWVVDHRVSSRNILLCLVGAPIGKRIIEHTANHFARLDEIRFTLLHVIPPLTLDGENSERIFSVGSDEDRGRIMEKMKLYKKNADELLGEGKAKLMSAGIPESRIEVKKKLQEKGIARDILSELEEGNHGILVIGRKESEAESRFGLGSKAYKLLCAARAFLICLVN
jgi:nucleotide-binding universal stress UspA family protein